uniref:Reverse transcriptase domain-containing protein n=1 Tax=Tanacetum cinerariifolium TaxID=118510 RepID=A0A6L2M442_TANCI|nr:reverse transcriptase domain-containing protein [Tanacetum cinerariifolium]
MREFMVAQKSSIDFVKNQFFNLKTKLEQRQKNHEDAIQDLKTKFGRFSDQCSTLPSGSLPSNTQTNSKPNPTNDKPYQSPPSRNEHMNAVFTEWTYDPPVNLNAKTTIIHDDSEDETDEAKMEVEPSPSKQTKSNLLPLKAYKLKIPYTQRLRKEKIEKQYAKFIDLIKEVRINVPLIDVLDDMPNYGKFLKDLVSNKTNSVECLALADLDASISLMPYSLYTSLSKNTLKPTKMSIHLANHTYQYLMGVAKNMLVQVGKFIIPVDFVNLQMEEDDKVPLILRRPFLHTADAIIRVKNKEINIGVGDDRITFLIEKAMQHSHSNDDTCFHMDVIDKINETSLDKEFEEFITDDVKDLLEQEEEAEDNFKELPLEEKLRIKTSIQDPLTDLEMKPLPKHLEYAYLEKRFSFSSIKPYFCKHKINFEDDAKTVVQRQRQLNLNMKEVAKKEIIKFLYAGIIYPIKDSPWCHFMVTEGIMLGHKVSSAGLEVDEAKINVTAKLPPPTNVKAIRRTFFDFNEGRIKAFETLKEMLINAPIMVSQDWSQPFKLMCDASDFTVGAVLRKRKGKHFCPIYFASKTINNAQQNYMVSEKELLAVVFAFDKFRSYLVLSKTIIFTYHSALKYLSGAENVVTGHLLRIKNSNLDELGDEDIDDNSPDETLMNVSLNNEDEIPDEMPQNSIQVSEIFDIWGIDFIGPFPKSYKFEYILVAIDYVSKWAEDEDLPTNDAHVVINFLKKLVSRFDQNGMDHLWSKHGFPSSYVELYDKHERSFIVNEHRVKLYHDEEQLNELSSEEIHLMCERGKIKAIPFMEPFPADYHKTMPWVAEKPFC